MQLKARNGRLALWLAGFVAATTIEASSRSEVASLDLRTSYYTEGGPYGHMTVVDPSGAIAANPTDWLRVHGGWSADIVSGASVQVRNGIRGVKADAITAASVKDFRQVGEGGFGFTHKNSSLDVGGSYSTEHDYRSKSFDALATTELFEKSTELSIAYARNWDTVCDHVQFSPDPNDRVALDSHYGCFTSDPTKTTHSIGVDSFEGTWTQSWTPTFITQSTASLQVQQGFLSNPYREVNIGNDSPVQEYEPSIRVREAVGAHANWYVRALRTAIRFGGRLYRDSWNVQSVTGDVEIERYFAAGLRLRARGRYYSQTHAAFYSDDYNVTERGQYHTGDRELSKMHSVLAGLRLLYAPHAGEKRWIGIFEGLEASIGADVVWFKYDDFTNDGDPLKKTALIGAVGLTFLF